MGRRALQARYILISSEPAVPARCLFTQQPEVQMVLAETRPATLENMFNNHLPEHWKRLIQYIFTLKPLKIAVDKEKLIDLLLFWFIMIDFVQK